MIAELTKQQEELVPVYLDKWLKAGLRTTQMDREKARYAVNFIYTDIMGLDKPKSIFFLDSPMAVQLAIHLFKNTNFKKLVDFQLGSELSSELDYQLESQLNFQLNFQLDSQLRSQLGSQLYSQLYSQLDSQLDSQLKSQLNFQLDSQLGSQLGSQLDAQLYPQFESKKISYAGFSFSPWWWGYGIPYYGFYDFILNVLFPEKTQEFEKLTKYTYAIKELHFAAFYPEVVFVSDFPKEINRNTSNQLHADGKPSMQYRDTYSLYNLNGIAVPRELAIAAASDLDAKVYLREENVDIRREAFRKIGINKVVQDLGAEIIDTYTCSAGGKYELLSVDIGLPEKKNYLKMKNPSMKDVWHIEGVNGNTCLEALAFRNGLTKFYAPEVIS